MKYLEISSRTHKKISQIRRDLLSNQTTDFHHVKALSQSQIKIWKKKLKPWKNQLLTKSQSLKSIFHLVKLTLKKKLWSPSNIKEPVRNMLKAEIICILLQFWELSEKKSSINMRQYLVLIAIEDGQTRKGDKILKISSLRRVKSLKLSTDITFKKPFMTSMRLSSQHWSTKRMQTMITGIKKAKWIVRHLDSQGWPWKICLDLMLIEVISSISSTRMLYKRFGGHVKIQKL